VICAVKSGDESTTFEKLCCLQNCVRPDGAGRNNSLWRSGAGFVCPRGRLTCRDFAPPRVGGPAVFHHRTVPNGIPVNSVYYSWSREDKIT